MSYPDFLVFHRPKLFRSTNLVDFLDITVPESNAQDLVIHKGPAVSPPDGSQGEKQFYIHKHQIDFNRVIMGRRVFELINPNWDNPYCIAEVNNLDAIMIPTMTYHRSWSGDDGSIVINQAARRPEFSVSEEFSPTSPLNDKVLKDILENVSPVTLDLEGAGKTL